MRGVVLLALMTSLLSCTEERPNQTKKIIVGSSDLNPVDVDGADASLNPDQVLSSARIDSLTYDQGSHSLVINLEYGGCRTVKHSLVFGACAESYPAQCDVLLIHEKNFDPSCKIAITEGLVYPLDPSFDAAYVKIRNKDQVVSTVLVDKTGDVIKNTQPPY